MIRKCLPGPSTATTVSHLPERLLEVQRWPTLSRLPVDKHLDRQFARTDSGRDLYVELEETWANKSRVQNRGGLATHCDAHSREIAEGIRLREHDADGRSRAGSSQTVGIQLENI